MLGGLACAAGAPTKKLDANAAVETSANRRSDERAIEPPGRGTTRAHERGHSLVYAGAARNNCTRVGRARARIQITYCGEHVAVYIESSRVVLAAGSAKVLMTPLEMTTSAQPSSTGSASAR